MSDDDFMMESDGDEETYDFDYEDDGSDQEADVDAENKYYNAKTLKENDPKASIEELRSVVAMEGEEKGDWGFKALKQICKISFNVLADKDNTLKYYKELLTYTKSAVTRNYSEKSLNNILDYISNSKDTAFMEEFYSTTLTALEEANNERLWVKTNLKLAKLWLDRKEYSRLNKILRALHKALQTDDGSDDQSKGTHLLEVYALEIQMYTETKNNKKLKELYHRTLKVKSAIPHPRIMGVIRECGGKMHMSEKQWDAAQIDFFESFRNYDEAGSPLRITVLKYLVLANMLVKSEISPFGAQETKPYKDDPKITAMTTLVEAYQRNDIAAFEHILRTNREDIMDDPFIAQHINDVLRNIRTAVLLRLIGPYTRINMGYIAQELNITSEEVEDLLIELILDGVIKGKIDSVEKRLQLDRERTNERFETMQELATNVDNLWKGVMMRIAV